MRLKKRICITNSVYCLLLYLLDSDFEDLKNTTYYFQEAISDAVASRFDSWERIVVPKYTFRRKLLWLFMLALKFRLRFLFCKGLEFFALDHIDIAAPIIGRHHYTALADSPHCYKRYAMGNGVYLNNLQTRVDRWKYNFVRKLIGPIWGRTLSMNKYCNWIINEYFDCADYVCGIPQSSSTILERWKLADEQKRNYILNVFGMSDILCRNLTKYDSILFTQPLVEDCGLNNDEVISIYRKLLQDNDVERCVIKAHPRDHFNYEKSFPNCIVVRTPAPFQLFAAIGCRYRIGLTICSTAVQVLPKDTKIVYAGASVHPKIEDAYGRG